MLLDSSYGYEEHAGNKTAPLNKFTSGSFDKASTQSTFGLTFQGGNSVEQMLSKGSNFATISGQAIVNKKTLNFLKDNPTYGFTSTSQRFSYMKEMQKMGQTPGPGSYDGTTAAPSSVLGVGPRPPGQPVPMGAIAKYGLNTISSSGDRFLREPSSRVNFPSPRGGASPTPLTGAHLKGAFATISGSSMFKDQTSRRDFASYIANNTNNTAALKNLGPGSYFNQKQPFLKRSFNASLPPNKFY